MKLDKEDALIVYLHGEGERSSLISAMEKIFVPHKLQTALFCYSDEAAIEVMSWIMKHGYRIPEEFVQRMQEMPEQMRLLSLWLCARIWLTLDR